MNAELVIFTILLGVLYHRFPSIYPPHQFARPFRVILHPMGSLRPPPDRDNRLGYHLHLSRN